MNKRIPQLWKRVLLVLLFSSLGFFVHAMESGIREACYLYEFEGKHKQAIQIFESIVKTGQLSDQQQALFHLGKIYDWEGNQELALSYYNQFIASNPQNSEMLYWVSGRLATLQKEPTKLVLFRTRIPAPVMKRIPGKYPAILAGESLWRNQGKNPMLRIPWKIGEETDVWEIGQNTAWVFRKDGDLFQEVQFKNQQVLSSVSLESPLVSSLRLQSGDWFLMTQKHHLLVRNGRILWKKQSPLGECRPEAELTLLRQVLLNCPDNAIHPIDLHNGSEEESIGLLESIDTILASPDGIWVTTPSSLWHFKPNRSRQPIWQQSFSSVHSVLMQRNRIALLESDGSLNLFKASDGTLLTRSRLEPGTLFAIDHRMGLITPNGNLQILDLDGQPLWRYQAGSPIAALPILTDSSIILALANQQVIGLNIKYYGLPQSDLMVRASKLDQLALSGEWDRLKRQTDTLLQQEPGNAKAWMYKARFYSEKQSKPDSAIYAWGQAARHSRNMNTIEQQSILKPYARRLGASWIQYLPPSTQSYPKLFGDSRSLFTIDAGNRSLVAMDPATGQFRWRATTAQLDQAFLSTNDGHYIAIASGYDVSIHDLSRKGRLIGTLSLPGKAFQMVMDRTGIIISTWNGFVIRFQKKNLEPVWSRKVFSTGSYLAPDEGILNVLSLDGELNSLTMESGISHGKIQTNGVPSGIAVGDKNIAIFTQEGRLSLYDSQTLNAIWTQQFSSQVFSAQFIPDAGKRTRILIGLADQRILLMQATDKKILWSIQGQGSVYIHPEIQGDKILIDQSASILSVGLNDGRIVQELLLPDGAGPLWTSSTMVFSSSAQGLLFAYPIPR